MDLFFRSSALGNSPCLSQAMTVEVPLPSKSAWRRAASHSYTVEYDVPAASWVWIVKPRLAAVGSIVLYGLVPGPPFASLGLGSIARIFPIGHTLTFAPSGPRPCGSATYWAKSFGYSCACCRPDGSRMSAPPAGLGPSSAWRTTITTGVHPVSESAPAWRATVTAVCALSALSPHPPTASTDAAAPTRTAIRDLMAERV